MARILCVDDSKMSLSMVRRVVEQMGHEPIEAASGTTAIDQATRNQSHLDLVLLDWNIPDPDGLAVLKWIRSHPVLHSIPIIMVTAMGHEEKIREAVREGVSDYVTKPFTPDDLKRRIINLLQ